MITSFRERYRFLSNFFYCSIRSHNQNWRTAEHLFQGMKTLDLDVREKIRKANFPTDAKRLGRRCKLRRDWNELRIEFMRQILRAKFIQNPKLSERLIATGDERLVEGNMWHDNFWGNCFCPNCVEIEGTNWLGHLLMKLRKELKTK